MKTTNMQFTKSHQKTVENIYSKGIFCTTIINWLSRTNIKLYSVEQTLHDVEHVFYFHPLFWFHLSLLSMALISSLSFYIHNSRKLPNFSAGSSRDNFSLSYQQNAVNSSEMFWSFEGIVSGWDSTGFSIPIKFFISHSTMDSTDSKTPIIAIVFGSIICQLRF